ncbi:DNA-binding transcriptional ArsR family regulator [Methanococcus voltae]|uniref:winged helix-turn-helix domain-containing protein n=1 Tax=Methanococcus voltae TaxID=2188 RepID=UPI001AE8D103|nr:winged helix-turn-helix domain-containing protein [Methanococcus voltae]MBP2143784.1 DNA-binding transcriptional ArsR family regulator [Methanococcus voltae]
MKQEREYNSDYESIKDIKKDIVTLYGKLNKLIENMELTTLEEDEGGKKSIISDFKNNEYKEDKEDNDDELYINIQNEEKLKKKYMGEFKKFLKKNKFLDFEGESPDEIIEHYKHRSTLSKKIPLFNKECNYENSDALEKQHALIKSLGVKDTENEIKEFINIGEKETYEILEPISNIHRLKIAKSLLYANHSFSELSNITGLKSGNLLFHLQKLQNSGIIFQKFEKGNYYLSKKGEYIIKSLFKIVNVSKLLE